MSKCINCNNLDKMNILKTIIKNIIRINELPPIYIQLNKIKHSINLDSIKLFKKNSDGKENNDLNNKLRENIIKKIINGGIPTDYYNYSLQWFNLKKSIDGFINKIIEDETSKKGQYISVECKIKAGRNFNYDFDIIYNFSKDNQKKNDEVQPEIETETEIKKKVEFKFNCCKIDECPQFISISSKFNTDYAEYFYENYIEQISKLYQTDIKISKEEYLKSVFQTSYKKHKWFQYIYENEEKHIEEKKKLVNKSINDYLLSIKDTIDLEKISKKLIDTQSQKIYMCYDPLNNNNNNNNNNNITIDCIRDDELSINGIKELKKNKDGMIHTIVCSTKSNTIINMLLRWRNHAGILNPAWQISIKR